MGTGTCQPLARRLLYDQEERGPKAHLPTRAKTREPRQAHSRERAQRSSQEREPSAKARKPTAPPEATAQGRRATDFQKQPRASSKGPARGRGATVYERDSRTSQIRMPSHNSTATAQSQAHTKPTDEHSDKANQASRKAMSNFENPPTTQRDVAFEVS